MFNCLTKVILEDTASNTNVNDRPYYKLILVLIDVINGGAFLIQKALEIASRDI